MTKYMDELEDYIRMNKAFEENKGEFDKVYNELLSVFGNTTCYTYLFRNYLKYKKIIKNIKVNKGHNHLKVGLIGELYTLMEPFANYDLENLLYKHNVEIKRFTNVTYLLFRKRKAVINFMKKMKNYFIYRLGADAHDNIYRAKLLCENDYDGIIHIKSSFCTPEIGAMPIINKVCKEYNVPIIYFSFDSNTSMVGIETRVEAFIDMLNMKKS